MQLAFNEQGYMAKEYDEGAIETLAPLEHIRRRPGMYIGRLGDGSHADDGIYVMLKEVVDNSIDEFIMGKGNTIVVDVDFTTGSVRVRDEGRGIPLGKVVDCVSSINTGAKYNTDVFQFSVGLNGVGTKAVNALSRSFVVQSRRQGQAVVAEFATGVLQTTDEMKTDDADGTEVMFTPDPAVFGAYLFRDEHIRRRIWHYAYLNTGLTLIYNGESISSPNGLLDLLNEEVAESDRLYEPLYYRSSTLEFAFLHTTSYGENYYSFVNGQYTADGGTHLSAFREGFLKGINEFANKNFQGVDVREGIVATLLAKVKEPLFESQTKNKLGNAEIRTPIVQEVKQAVSDLLYKHPVAAKILIDRIAFNEQLRRELAAVRKEAKEKQRKISYKIPKLRDCKHHWQDRSGKGDQTMIFLAEGDSASASLVGARDPMTQAVFALRGKPLNVFGMKMDQLYKNEELFNLMSALNIEEDISQLRYNKVVLATDADVDGMHIRNLLLTFFLTYFEGLALNGHLYILETPLFKVRNRERTIYCYSEKERDQAVKQLKKGVEITRFKGLGEISAKEFKPFIGSDIRLIPITVNHFSDIKPTLQFYMGKNTPQRRQLIMHNLNGDVAV
jgi:topoisomerase-4 subunit B